MLKILHAKLQLCMNQELPNVKPGFRKGRGTRDQNANIHWIIEKARECQKNICCIDYANAFDLWITTNWKVFKEIGIQTTLPASCKTCIQVKKQWLEPDVQQQTGSKLGKEYTKVLYCHLLI